MSTDLVPIDSDAFKRMETVAELHLKGKTPYAIARELSIKVVEAKNAIAQWQEIVNNDMASRDAARDHLNAMVQRYDRLISESHDNLRNLQLMSFDEKVSAQINATLKNIADFDAKRVDLLQKAGLLDASDLGDEIAEMEEKHQLLIEILRNDLCDRCKPHVMHKLKRITGQVEEIRVEHEVVDAEVVESD